MTIETQYHKLNNIILNSDSELPILSESTKKILQNDLSMALPNPVEMNSLRDRATKIENLSKELQQAKDHHIRNKIFACLKGVLITGILAGSILLGIYVDPCFFLGMLISFIADMAFSWQALFLLNQHKEKGEYLGNEPKPMLITLGMGSIYEAFRRVSRIEKILEKELHSLNELHSYNLEQLPANVEFYKSSETVVEKLNEQIKRAEVSLALLKQLPIKTERGETELNIRIASLFKAKEEVEAMSQFYLPFNSL